MSFHTALVKTVEVKISSELAISFIISEKNGAGGSGGQVRYGASP